MREFTSEEKELIVNTPITVDCFDISDVIRVTLPFNRYLEWLEVYRTSIIFPNGSVSENGFEHLVEMLPNSYKVVKP